MPPVEEYPVHEKVRQKSGFRYGCNSDKVYPLGYYAPDRIYRPDGTFHIVQSWIKVETSRKCRNFYLWSTDSGCADCKREKDQEYADRMSVL